MALKSLRETLVPGEPLTVEAMFHDLPDDVGTTDHYVTWFRVGDDTVQDTVIIKTPGWKPRTIDGEPELTTFALPPEDAKEGHPWATKAEKSSEESEEDEETEEA